MPEYYQVHELPAVNVIEFDLPDSIDTMEFDRLNESLRQDLDGRAGQAWIIDLTRVHYIGSAMLGLMVNLRQQVKSAGGTLVLCGLSRRLTEIFRASSMERLFTVTRTRPEALRRTGAAR